MNFFHKTPLAMPDDGADRPPGHDPLLAGTAQPRRGRGRRLADLLPRIASGLVLAAAALTAVWRGGAFFAVVWFAAALAVGLEWQNLIAASRPRRRFLLTAAALAGAACLAARGRFDLAIAVLGLAGAALAVAADQPQRVWAFAGIVYAGALIVSTSALYASPAFGARSIFWLFATVWGADVFAYFGGRLIGGRKLWPQVSPSKTWSGTLCGVIAGASIGALIGVQGLNGARLAVPVFALGLVTALVSQAGDILESSIKRRFGRQGFERPDPRPWRLYGPARWICRRRRLRRPVWSPARVSVPGAGPVRLDLD